MGEFIAAEVEKTDQKIEFLLARIGRHGRLLEKLEGDARAFGVTIPTDFSDLPQRGETTPQEVVVDTNVAVPVSKLKKPLFQRLRKVDHLQHQIRRLFYAVDQDTNLIARLETLRDEHQTLLTEARGSAADTDYQEMIGQAFDRVLVETES